MSKPELNTVRAAIYARISSDREGEGLGVERQEDDCRALARRMGWEVAAVFVDNDISASTKSRKVRPQYDAMLRGARRREFGAVLAYSNSRLTRRPRELEDLIDLHAGTGVLIKTVVSGDDDLSTADGRMVARIKANVDAAEAERTAERVARAKKQAAEQGRYRGGRRPFGYEADGVTIRTKEADHLRHATQGLLAGRSLAAVTRDLNERGSRSSTGREWDAVALRNVLLRPRNAGLVHTGRAHARDVQIVAKAAWPAIVDEDQWRAVHSMLTAPSRLTRQGNSEPNWLGSGIYTCGLCGAPMRVTGVGATPSRPKYKRQHHYRCTAEAHLTTHQQHTDEYVAKEVATMLRDPRVVAAMTAGEGDALQPDRERRSLLVTRLAQIERDYDEGLIDGRRYKSAVDRVEVEMGEIEERLAAGVQAATVLPIFSALDPGQVFLDAPIDVKRAVLRSVLRVEVVKAAGKGKAWTSDRVRLLPVAS